MLASRRPTRWRCFLAFGLVLAARLPAAAQDLVLEPLSSSVLACDTAELVVEARLRNASQAVSGYQIFLRFPAEHFTPLRYEPAGITASVFRAGPAPFGEGFTACAAGVADPWDDGRGEDVVAVAATTFAEGTSEEPLEGDEALLGRFFFRPRGVPGAAAFSLNLETCRPPFDQQSRLFDAAGNILGGERLGSFSVEVAGGGRAVESLACASEGASGVRLSWSLPAASGIAGFRVYRGGALVAMLQASATGFSDVLDEDLPLLEYEVVTLIDGDREGCKASCQVSRRTFIRGDTNRDGSINISDPVVLLRHLFGGQTLPCQDAADFDDSGILNLTDAVQALAFIFQNGPRPPPPFPEPGVDPTPDGLGCQR
jgi:hypothetical protein